MIVTLKIYKISTIGPDNLYIIIKIEYFKFLYNRFKNEFSFVKEQIAKYYNIKKIKGPSFEKGDKAYLLCKNIIIKQLNNKLDFKKLELFIIIYKILKYNYKLLLFKIMQIHFIFYISLFEFISKSTEI